MPPKRAAASPAARRPHASPPHTRPLTSPEPVSQTSAAPAVDPKLEGGGVDSNPVRHGRRGATVAFALVAALVVAALGAGATT
eukprot:2145570-Prymnesium_polylepis.1